MSDSDIIATPQHESDPTYDRVHDKEDHLRASFVREVMDAVADGDDEAARALVAGLHPADIADLIELARGTSAEAWSRRWRALSTPTSMPSSTSMFAMT